MAHSNDLTPDVEAALVYLQAGGLDDIANFAMVAYHEKYEKVMLNPDLAIALCILASEQKENKNLH